MKYLILLLLLCHGKASSDDQASAELQAWMERVATDHPFPSHPDDDKQTGSISLKVVIENYSRYILRFITHYQHCESSSFERRNILAYSEMEFLIESDNNLGICGSYSWQVMYQNGKHYKSKKGGKRFLFTYKIPTGYVIFKPVLSNF